LDRHRKGECNASKVKEDAGTALLVAITFTLPAIEAETVAICGEFNDWATGANLLERDTEGSGASAWTLSPAGHIGTDI